MGFASDCSFVFSATKWLGFVTVVWVQAISGNNYTFSNYSDALKTLMSLTLTLRRPFLIKNLENVMRRFLQSLELFEENERKKLAIFTALAFSQKLSGLPPETVFQPMLKDNLVGKGLRGKVEDNLLEFFPSAKRTEESFSEHFTKEWLVALVEYNEKKIFEVKLKEMKSALTTQITEETDMSEVIETVKQRVKDAKLPDVVDPISSLFKNLMDYAQGKQVFDESPERECNGDFEYSKLGDDASRICASNDGEDLDSGELIHFCCCKLLHLCHIDFDLRRSDLILPSKDAPL
ncbi:hypothetical protein FF1_013585 [Malus domestica]